MVVVVEIYWLELQCLKSVESQKFWCFRVVGGAGRGGDDKVLLLHQMEFHKEW